MKSLMKKLTGLIGAGFTFVIGNEAIKNAGSEVIGATAKAFKDKMNRSRADDLIFNAILLKINIHQTIKDLLTHMISEVDKEFDRCFIDREPTVSKKEMLTAAKRYDLVNGALMTIAESAKDEKSGRWPAGEDVAFKFFAGTDITFDDAKNSAIIEKNVMIIGRNRKEVSWIDKCVRMYKIWRRNTTNTAPDFKVMTTVPKIIMDSRTTFMEFLIASLIESDKIIGSVIIATSLFYLLTLGSFVFFGLLFLISLFS